MIEVWVAEDQDPSPQLDEIERLATRRGVKMLSVGRRRIESVARTYSSQGVIARAAPLEEVSLEDLCAGSSGAEPFILMLDGVHDPQNLGSLLRSADCAGATGVVLARHRAAHITPAVTKVAAGAVEHLRIGVVPGIPNALRTVEELGLVSIGLDPQAEQSIFDFGEEANGPVALVLGAEGRGLASLTRRRCTTLARIPQHGALESLNVAAAGAIACFELARRRAASAAARS